MKNQRKERELRNHLTEIYFKWLFWFNHCFCSPNGALDVPSFLIHIYIWHLLISIFRFSNHCLLPCLVPCGTLLMNNSSQLAVKLDVHGMQFWIYDLNEQIAGLSGSPCNYWPGLWCNSRTYNCREGTQVSLSSAFISVYVLNLFSSALHTEMSDMASYSLLMH